MCASVVSIDRVRAKHFDGYRSGSTSGIPVIFLHGWAGSKDIWLGMLRNCPDGFQFISLDLPGTGGTPALINFSPEHLAQWLADVADEIGVNEFHIVGHSMGGNIAAWVAKLLSMRILSLTLIAPALDGDRLGAAGIYCGPNGTELLWLSWMGAGLLGFIDEIHPHKHTGGKWRSWWRRYRYVYRDNSVPTLMQQIRFLVSYPFALPQLHRSLRILIIHGTRDKTVPVDLSRRAYLSRSSKSKLIVYSEAMHCPMDEELERTLGHIRDFIEN